MFLYFFFSSRRRHTRWPRDWSSDVCSSDLEARSIHTLDTTAMEVLLSIVETLEIWNIEIHFSGLTSPVKDVVLRSGLARKLGGTHFHIGTHQAVIYLLNKWDRLEKQMKSEGEDAEVKTDRLTEYLGRVD